MTHFRENLRGILAISAANLLFLINDTMIKLASPVMPLGEILFFRGLFATALLVPIAMAAGVLKFLPTLWNLSLVLRTHRRDLCRHPVHPGAIQHADRQHQRHPPGGAADGHGLRGDLPRREGRLAALGGDRGGLSRGDDRDPPRPRRLRRLQPRRARLDAVHHGPRPHDPDHAARYPGASRRARHRRRRLPHRAGLRRGDRRDLGASGQPTRSSSSAARRSS